MTEHYPGTAHRIGKASACFCSERPFVRILEASEGSLVLPVSAAPPPLLGQSQRRGDTGWQAAWAPAAAALSPGRTVCTDTLKTAGSERGGRKILIKKGANHGCACSGKRYN